MRIEEDTKLDFSDVLIRPKRSKIESRNDVDLSRHFVFLHSKVEFVGIPIIASNMDGVGTLSMEGALRRYRCLTCFTKTIDQHDISYSLTPNGIPSVGLNDIDKIKFFSDRVATICIDVANGYTEKFLDFVKKIRDNHSKLGIIAGNVATPDVVESLILGGADVVKVGIGSGSVCTTRIKTGIGYPQLSSIIECADAAHGLGGLIISDGGCTNSGDIVKAFAAGADFVMLGGMLAGHAESEIDQQTEISFYGSSSESAQKKNYGEKKSYRASEGKEVKIPYRGNVSDTIEDILGGIRSACAYVGASKLKELSKRTTFIKVNRQVNNIFGENDV